ncbi:MAG: hypothetical protein HY921_11000 [Elusimicrobia bacterium]|nr:hypothetical protein [Elusimicrobiota bacterium]
MRTFALILSFAFLPPAAASAQEWGYSCLVAKEESLTKLLPAGESIDGFLHGLSPEKIQSLGGAAIDKSPQADVLRQADGFFNTLEFTAAYEKGKAYFLDQDKRERLLESAISPILGTRAIEGFERDFIFSAYRALWLFSDKIKDQTAKRSSPFHAAINDVALVSVYSPVGVRMYAPQEETGGFYTSSVEKRTDGKILKNIPLQHNQIQIGYRIGAHPPRGGMLDVEFKKAAISGSKNVNEYWLPGSPLHVEDDNIGRAVVDGTAIVGKCTAVR